MDKDKRKQHFAHLEAKYQSRVPGEFIHLLILMFHKPGDSMTDLYMKAARFLKLTGIALEETK